MALIKEEEFSCTQFSSAAAQTLLLSISDGSLMVKTFLDFQSTPAFGQTH